MQADVSTPSASSPIDLAHHTRGPLALLLARVIGFLGFAVLIVCVVLSFRLGSALNILGTAVLLVACMAQLALTGNE